MKYLLFIVLLVAVVMTAGCVGGDKDTGVTPKPKQTVIVTPTQTTLNLITTSGTKLNPENKFDITSPGYYSLDSDVTHSTPFGIKIRVSSVTIDGNGHTISPSGKMIPSYGILISEKDINGNPISNVQIRNIVIKNEDTGIFITELKNSTFSDVSLKGNDKAIQIIRTDHVSIQNSEIMNNREGILIENSQNNTISKNNVHDNQISGLHLYSASKNNVVSENIFSNNNYGISMGDVYFTTVSRNTVSDNLMGIHVHAGSSSNKINKNKLVNNDIFVETDCVNNIVNDNWKSSNQPVVTTQPVITTQPVVTTSVIDSDNDRLSDWEEINVYHTNPSNPDTDGDYIIDGKEIQLGTNPLKEYTYGNVLDDFNRVFVYCPQEVNCNNSDKDSSFLSRIPDVEARGFTANEGQISTLGAFDMERIVKISLKDPLIDYLSKKTEIILPNGDKTGKIIVDGKSIYEKYELQPNFSPSYYITHGKKGVCMHVALAVATLLKKKGEEVHYFESIRNGGGHAYLEAKFGGKEYGIDFDEIFEKQRFYELNNNMTNIKKLF